MKFIPLKSSRLKKYLQNITDILYTPNIVQLISRTIDRKDDLQPETYGCSDEYLKKAFEMNVREYGFPRSCLGMGMREITPELMNVISPVSKQVERIGLFLGTPTNALVMAYPDRGYIGWHHNGNAPGFNILMTYSQDGDGCFKYWDREKQEIVVMPDEPGWTVKVGYYPSENKKDESDKVYWHCAETKKQRISVAYVLNHRNMWENMIDSITDGEFDKSVLNQFQMTH